MIRAAIVASTSLVLVVLSIVGSAQQPQPQAVFRAGVDIVLVDVTVLDKAGKPVPDLRAEDFAVEVGGKRRPLVGVHYVSSGRTQPVPSRDATASQAASSLETSAADIATETRSIIVIVDTDNIRAGDGRGSMESLADYFDSMPSTDRIGLVAYPFGTPEVPPTSDRTVLRSGLERTVGTSHQLRSCDPTFGEAASDGVGWSGRVIAMGCRADPSRLAAAKSVYRQQTRRLFDVIARVALSMVEVPGTRAIVLVSEGLYVDEETRRDLQRLGEALERARVVLHVIHLDFPFVEASARGNATLSRRTDDQYGFDAMVETAFAGGGEAIRSISRPTGAIRRIDAALSGRYILAFERIVADKLGERLRLKVNVSRKGSDVRARSHVTIAK